MDDYSRRGPESTAKISGHPIHPMLVPIPIACFIGALLTDIGFLATSDPFWARASGWLLGAGIVGGILAAVAGATDFFSNARIRALPRAWQHGIGNALALLVAVVNVFLRRPEWTGGELPFGIILSFVTVGILGFTGWLGGDLVYRHGVGVADRDPRPPGRVP
jgi:uncharacterized membrane protein